MRTPRYIRQNRWGTLVLVCAAAALPVRAAVLFDNGIAPGAVSDTGFSDLKSNFRLADDFTFSSPVLVNKINFLGGYYPNNSPISDAFTLTIYNDDPIHNTPDSASIVAQISLNSPIRANTGVFYDCQIYSYSSAFSAIALSPGTRYWLSIANDSRNDPDDTWVWAGSNASGNRGLSGSAGASWFAVGGSCSFSLEGTLVPEPSTAVVATLGLLCVFSFRKARVITARVSDRPLYF